MNEAPRRAFATAQPFVKGRVGRRANANNGASRAAVIVAPALGSINLATEGEMTTSWQGTRTASNSPSTRGLAPRGNLFLTLIVYAIAAAVCGQAAQLPRSCMAEVKIVWVDLYGEPLPIGGEAPAHLPGDKSFVILRREGGREEKRFGAGQPIRVPCGRVSLTSFISGGRNETVSVKLEQGVNLLTVGVGLGSLTGTRQGATTGIWPVPLTGCKGAVVRAVAPYGEFGPRHAPLEEGGRVSFQELPEGRYIVAIIGHAPACRVRPRVATASNNVLSIGDLLTEWPK